jgi:uncharacterized protein (DUF486 family)
VTQWHGNRKAEAPHAGVAVRADRAHIILSRMPSAGSLPPMSPHLSTIVLLICSNVFMTFAWYAHLKSMNHKPWIIAALVSWGIALFEYLLQVPANRIGHRCSRVGQLKILQEVITLTGVRALLHLLSERRPEVGLPLGGPVHPGRGALALPDP